MRGKKGSLITQPPFEVLIAMVFAFLIFGFVIAQSGGIQGILDMICDRVPDLCGGDYSTLEYETAKQSKQMLECGINTVLSGEEQCAEIVVTGSSLTGAATAEPEEFENISEGNEASLYCDFNTGYPELEYKARKKALGFLWYASSGPSIWYVLDSKEWKFKSPEMCEDVAEMYCEYRSIERMNQRVFDEVDDVHKEIKANLMDIESNNEGEKFKKGLEIFKDVMLSDKYGEDDNIIIHHRNGEKEVLDKYDIGDIEVLGMEKTATCGILNFNLPESFGGGLFNVKTWKEYINGFGDPSFLVYYQFFPMGEDADWGSVSEWFGGFGKLMFLAMCGWDVVSGIRGVAKASKNAIKNKITDFVEKKLGKEASEEIVDEAAEIAAKQGELGLVRQSIRESATKMEFNSGAVEWALDQGVPKTPTNILNYFDDLRVKNGLEKLSPTTRTRYLKEVDTILKKGRSIANFEKDILTSEIVEKAAEKTILKRIGEKAWTTLKPALPRIMKYVGIDSVAAYYLARIDSELGKFDKKHPNSLVLGMPLVKEEASELFSNEVETDFLEIGKPLILLKKEFMNDPKNLHFASPCHANLEIKNDDILCTLYTYDSSNRLSTCDNPNEPGWWDKVIGKTSGSCDYFPKKDEAAARVYKINPVEKEEELARKGKEGDDVQIYDKDVKITVNISGKDEQITRDEIIDPIHDLKLYFDQDNQKIDYIDNGSGPEESQVYLYDKCSFRTNSSMDPINPIEREIMGFDEPKIFTCRKEITELIGDTNAIPYKKETEVGYYWNVTPDDKVGDFLAMAILKNKGTGTTERGVSFIPKMIIILKDQNNDGILDMLVHDSVDSAGLQWGHWLQDFITYASDSRIFIDNNFDGKYDSYLATNCEVPAVAVIADRTPYKDDENNYCYKTTWSGWTIGSTVVMFGVSALAKTVGGFGGWLLATVVDCGIAYAEYKWDIATSNWPSGKYIG